MRFYYFFRENGKRNEISSRILKNNILSRTREDEKKDEKVDPEVFTIEIPKSVLRNLNYAESQLAPLIIGKLEENEARTLACGAYGALCNVILYLEKQVQDAESQKSD